MQTRYNVCMCQVFFKRESKTRFTTFIARERDVCAVNTQIIRNTTLTRRSRNIALLCARTACLLSISIFFSPPGLCREIWIAA